MKPEVWISIYAAILASVALALNIKTWFDAGIRLKLVVIADGVVTGGDSQFDENNLVILTVINRGRLPPWFRASCFMSTKAGGASGATNHGRPT